MFQRMQWLSFLLIVTISASDRIAQAADVTQHVPQDALGFAVVRNVAATSAKLESLARMFEAPVPAPLALFKLQTGFEEGFDEDGDLLIGLLAPPDEFASPSPMALVPVTDYGAFVQSFNGDPSGEISPVTVSDEDVLVARKGEYALFMNPDARERMRQILAAEPAPLESVTAMGEWVSTNNGTLVVLPAGARMLVAMAREGLATARGEMERSLEGAPVQQEVATLRAAFDIYNKMLNFVGDEVTAAALGLAIDGSGNVQFGVRAVAKEDGALAQIGEIEQVAEPLAGLPADGYVVAGGGPWPEELSDAMSRFSFDIMKSMPDIYGLQDASDEDMQRLTEAFQDAMRGLTRYAFVLQSGEDKEPIYSNIYTLFDVEDAEQYFAEYKQALSIWNEIAGAQDAPSFAYEMNEEPVAGKPGMEIVMDFSKAMGMQQLPQAPQVMELMFGEGGKMRAYFAQVDEDTILIGYSPKTVVEKMVEAIRQGREGEGLAGDENLAVTSELLPAGSPFVAYISPKGGVQWFRRMMTVTMGALGGGGPVIPEYPQTPPVGIAADLEGRVLQTDVMLPAEMLRGLSQFIKENQ